MRRLLLSVLVCLILTGCTAAKRIESVKSEDFPEIDTSKRLPNLPFSHSWVWEGVEPGKYQAVYIPPIRIDPLKRVDWHASASAFVTSQEDYLSKAQSVADYCREQMVAEFQQYPDTKLQVASGTGQGVAVLEFALTELEFSHPIARAGTLAVPVPGTGAALSAVTDPRATFFLKIKDGETEQLLATAADRKFSPIRIIDLNKLTVVSSLHEICRNWAKEIADAFNKGRFAEVERRGVYKLLPW